MINVAYDFQNGMSLKVWGHAPRGFEIVCAAMSTLTDTLASVLSKQENENKVILRGGYGELYSDNIENLPYFTFVIQGITLIAKAYPECIEVNK